MLIKCSYVLNANFLNNFFRLSVRNDTFKARERRRRMEEELSRLEEAIRVYSRPKVYVPLQPNK